MTIQQQIKEACKYHDIDYAELIATKGNDEHFEGAGMGSSLDSVVAHITHYCLTIDNDSSWDVQLIDVKGGGSKIIEYDFYIDYDGDDWLERLVKELLERRKQLENQLRDKIHKQAEEWAEAVDTTKLNKSLFEKALQDFGKELLHSLK